LLLGVPGLAAPGLCTWAELGEGPWCGHPDKGDRFACETCQNQSDQMVNWKGDGESVMILVATQLGER
jgi:hypothetical protein